MTQSVHLGRIMYLLLPSLLVLITLVVDSYLTVFLIVFACVSAFKIIENLARQRYGLQLALHERWATYLNSPTFFSVALTLECCVLAILLGIVRSQQLEFFIAGIMASVLVGVVMFITLYRSTPLNQGRR